MVIIQINKVGLPFEPNVKIQLQNPMQKHVQIVILGQNTCKGAIKNIGCQIPS